TMVEVTSLRNIRDSRGFGTCKVQEISPSPQFEIVRGVSRYRWSLLALVGYKAWCLLGCNLSKGMTKNGIPPCEASHTLKYLTFFVVMSHSLDVWSKLFMLDTLLDTYHEVLIKRSFRECLGDICCYGTVKHNDLGSEMRAEKRDERKMFGC
ncbi:hypothetical protein Tco_1012268, partial [Tanacetum coccineum]